jgi:SCP-2 sterol transfer family
VPAFLSPEWLDELARLGSEHAPLPGITATVQVVVSGGPEKDVKFVVVLHDGKIDAAERRVDSAAELTLTFDYANAVAVQEGELDPSVAFMQGRMKTAGDTGLLLQLLPLTRTPAFRTFREKLAAVTEL